MPASPRQPPAHHPLVGRLARAAHAALLLLPSCGPAPSAHRPPRVEALDAVESAALALVEKRTSAFNAHDLATFLELYAEDVVLYSYPARELGRGRAHLRRIFAEPFERGDGAIEVLHRQALGPHVLSREIFRMADFVEEYLAIYSVRDGRILEVRFVERKP